MPTPSSTDIAYQERLWPAWWVWAVAVIMGSAGTLTFAPINIYLGFAAAAVLIAIYVTLLTISTPTITVSDTKLSAGKATIDLTLLDVSAAEALTKEGTIKARGVELNALAFLLIRGWIDTCVKIPVNDPSDPTPYWLISSRNPEEFVIALQKSATRQRATQA